MFAMLWRSAKAMRGSAYTPRSALSDFQRVSRWRGEYDGLKACATTVAGRTIWVLANAPEDAITRLFGRLDATAAVLADPLTLYCGVTGGSFYAGATTRNFGSPDIATWCGVAFAATASLGSVVID